MEKNKEKDKESKQKYMSEPKFRRYAQAIQRAEGKEQRKALYKEQQRLEKEYAKQEAQIALGTKPSKSQYIAEKLSKRLSSAFTKGKFLKKPKFKIEGIDPKKVIASMPYSPMVREGRTGYFNDEYEKEIKWLEK